MKCSSQFIDLISQEGRELTLKKKKKNLREPGIKVVGQTPITTCSLGAVSVRTLHPTSDRLFAV